ncbi:MAG: PHP domain-containing protein [Candidatus Omnitrophota bacterium]
MKFADLHLHTDFSDGTYTPEELVKSSLNAGLSAISITDHDTVLGVSKAIEIAESYSLEVIPGVEISSEYDSKEVHILGYLIDYKADSVLAQLDTLRKNRIERIYKITEKLNSLGLSLKAEDVFDIAGKSIPGRLHVARALEKKGLVGSIYEAFNKYIGDSGPAYVLGFRFSLKEAIDFIRGNGGIPVLAHPYTLNNDVLITDFIRLGIMGLEIYYPEHSQGEVNYYLNLAKEYNLLVTGGSDCHGNAKPKVRIGSMKIPYTLVERLKETKEKL